MSSTTETTTANVNYDSEAILECEFEGIDYRLDSGKDGTALCVSHRTAGTWDWEFIAEAKWDATMLRCKPIHRSVCDVLSRQLRAVC